MNQQRRDRIGEFIENPAVLATLEVADATDRLAAAQEVANDIAFLRLLATPGITLGDDVTRENLLALGSRIHKALFS